MLDFSLQSPVPEALESRSEEKRSHMPAKTYSAMSPRVLVVEDDDATSMILTEFLTGEDCRVETAKCLDSAQDLLARYSFDLVLLDLHLGTEDGFSLIPCIVRQYPHTKVVVVTGHGSIDLAVRSVQTGASGFITKPFSFEKINEALRPVIDRRAAAVACPDEGPWDELGLIGNSPAIRAVQSNILRMKDVDSTVLITGDSGTGKELIARALHLSSNRNDQRFEAVNCGAIPENLIESELFGHRKGSFTDAKADRKGIFEVCKDGVLFLDEIGELPLQMQVKLLRVLQEREIMPVGASTPVKVNTRVIAATNRDLSVEVREGRFREDLYFRLAVLCINLPPLSHRLEDVPLLVNHFIHKFNERFNKSIGTPSKELMTRLVSYSWPGNIRELQNAIERGVVLSPDGQLHFEDMLGQQQQHPNAAASDNGMAHIPLGSLTEAKETFESGYLRRLLEATHGNVSEAARLSGRYRADLYRLFSKYEIDPNQFKH